MTKNINIFKNWRSRKIVFRKRKKKNIEVKIKDGGDGESSLHIKKMNRTWKCALLRILSTLTNPLLFYFKILIIYFTKKRIKFKTKRK